MIKAAFIRIASVPLGMLYSILKMLPVQKNKILFLSRQSSKPSMDYLMLLSELSQRVDDIQVVFICNRIKPGLKSKLSFVRDMLKSLYHLATSCVCVLDSYWPTVSLFEHRPELTVIQMWHAIGKIKQSGLQTVGKPGGRNKDLAEALHMHAHYDYVIAGAPFWNDFYCQCFGCNESQLLNYGLPRMDFLSSSMEETARAIKETYPCLSERKVVLYAPTFRKGATKNHLDLIESLSKEDCEVVVKAHLNQDLEVGNVLRCNEYSSMQLLSVADVLITDYSAIALEAATAGIPTLYYLYDFDDYRDSNGFNMDIPEEMPSCVVYDSNSLQAKVHEALVGKYPYDEFRRYQDKFLVADRGHATKDIASFVLGCLSSSSEKSNKEKKTNSVYAVKRGCACIHL